MSNTTRIIADLAENGGGTYDALNLQPVTWTTGFAVAIGGVQISADDATPTRIASAVRMVKSEWMTPFVGTWRGGGTVYVDAVEYIRDPGRAKARGRDANQLSIYDFATGEVVWLVSEEQE